MALSMFERAKRSLAQAVLVATAFGCAATTLPTRANAQETQVYRGAPRLPDFQGADRRFGTYRTRISNEMRTGPNFAWRYAVVEIGCGTSCRFVFVGDVSTGRVYAFPYGGEEFYMLNLRYNVKENYVTARWISDGVCMEDFLEWDGARFTSANKRVVGPRTICEAL